MLRLASPGLLILAGAVVYPGPVGWYEALCALALLLGALAAWRRHRRLLGVALLLLFLATALRVGAVRSNGRVQLVRLQPPVAGAPWLLDALVPEAGATVWMGQLLTWAGRFHRDPEPDLASIVRRGYVRMRAQDGSVPTPAPGTYLGLQSPQGHDVVVIGGEDPTPDAVVFLHGYAGNFTLYCWHVAEAFRGRARVYCPSMGPQARWWTRAGQRTLASTLDHARAQGATRIVLAGLSNGAVGAGRLAPRFRKQLAGLILLSGSPRVPPPRGLPVLVVHGTADPMSSASAARRYARQAGRAGVYHAVEGGHFIALSRHGAVSQHLRHWFGTAVAGPAED